jgi:uncharacterized membrane protein YagU involved in acid resistance
LIAKPKGLAVPKISEVPAAAIVQCVTLIQTGQDWSYFTSLDLERAIVSYLAHLLFLIIIDIIYKILYIYRI